MLEQSFRHVLNGILKANSNYLEIVTWKSSTACAVPDRKHLNAWIIDDLNWQEVRDGTLSGLREINAIIDYKLGIS
jgi:hypothetical protein